jgi:glyoxylase-like metal-dependent hydrolase (beta-lactamase superfamily II)
MKPSLRVSVIVFTVFVTSLHSHGTSAEDAPSTPSGTLRISDSVLVVDAEGTNSVVIAGSTGLVVIDTGPGPAVAARIRDAAAKVLGRSDGAFVISTHCHWDHVDGN